ncbi:hypothetical protein QFZ63_000219 [Streptomyces sp. B3I7]|nr:hypothetical protein [Streptomyces sp. B3I7]
MTTQAGDLELAIPKLRAGSFLPSLLKRRRHIDQALYAVVVEASVGPSPYPPTGRRPKSSVDRHQTRLSHSGETARLGGDGWSAAQERTCRAIALPSITVVMSGAS